MIRRGGQAPFVLRSSVAGLNFCPLYGQSVSVGANEAVISTDALSHALMFASASAAHSSVRPQYSAAFVATSHPAEWYTSLVPAKEQDDDDAVGGHRETPCSAFAKMLNQLLIAEDGAPAGAAYKSLVSAPGYGGTSIGQLSPGAGTGHWERLACQINFGHVLGMAAGYTYAVPCLGWIQGTADYLGATSRTDYRDALAALHACFASEAKSGRQSFTPQLLVAQVSSHLGCVVATPTIALAQLDAIDLAPTTRCLAATMYPLDDYLDDYHPPAAAVAWLGAYLGMSAKRRCWDGDTSWSGAMRMQSAVRDATGITVTYDPATGCHLVDDSAEASPWVTPMADGNLGFQVVDSGLSPVAITSVTITGDNTLYVECSQGGGAGSVLRYAWAGTAGQTTPGRVTGARGSIRDNYGDSITYEIEPGDTRPMHRWAAHEEIATT